MPSLYYYRWHTTTTHSRWIYANSSAPAIPSIPGPANACRADFDKSDIQTVIKNMVRLYRIPFGSYLHTANQPNATTKALIKFVEHNLERYVHFFSNACNSVYDRWLAISEGKVYEALLSLTDYDGAKHKIYWPLTAWTSVCVY